MVVRNVIVRNTVLVPSPLDDLLCFAMYTASHATTQAYREVLAPWKLTYTQFLVLVVLDRGGRTVSELGDELSLDSGTLSPLLRRLEQRGLIGRRRDENDERIVRVSLTPAGARTTTDALEAAACLGPAFVGDGSDVAGAIRQLRELAVRMRALKEARRVT